MRGRFQRDSFPTVFPFFLLDLGDPDRPDDRFKLVYFRFEKLFSTAIFAGRAFQWIAKPGSRA